MENNVNDLIAFKRSFKLAMQVFEISKGFPKEERYSLTDQVRRSSRAVCANISEAYAKRRYEAHFINKLSDADMENTETQTWILFALSCGYIDPELYKQMQELSQETGRLLEYMMQNPEKFRRKSSQ
jgi:four helix bundle protein